MSNDVKVIKIDDVEYVRKDSIQEMPEKVDGMEYCIVRTHSASVFAGFIAKRNGQEVEMVNARRLWYWDGASSLSQLAMEGVKKPENCKFPQEVKRVLLLQAIEIIPATKASQQSIKGVAIWKR